MRRQEPEEEENNASLLALGVDIAKETITAAVWQHGTGTVLGTFPNTPDGFATLEQHVQQNQSTDVAVHLVLEATAGYELALAVFAHQRGWQVSMPNPKRVRDWAKGMGRRAKSDTQDALLLAQYAAERDPVPWHPMPDHVQTLDGLLRRKDDITEVIRQECNRKDMLRQRPGTPSIVLTNIDQMLVALETALSQIEQAMQDLLDQHPDLREQKRQLLTVPGIGPKDVLYLLVLLHRWNSLTHGRGTPKQLTAYVGLDPQTYESGTSVHRRATISRMGDRSLRQRLFLSALGGVRGKNILRAFYQRLVGRGKPKMVALVAASRKVLLWAWAVFRQGTTFDPTKGASRMA